MEWQTTFWMDFTIADRFGINAVKDTFKRAYEEWKDNYVYLTELEIVMNWKCWDWYNKGNMKLSKLYSDYYYKCRDYAFKTFTKEQLDYHFEMTD